MRAILVDNQGRRVGTLRGVLEAAGSQCVVYESWLEASTAITSTRPDMVVAALSTLVYEGLTSFLAADAQLRVMRIPAVVLYDDRESRDLEAVRALASFRQYLKMPAPNAEIAQTLNSVTPGVASAALHASPTRVGESRLADAQLEKGALVDGRYTVEEFVAAGGMGHIYRARQEPLGRPVALKLVRADLASDPDTVARFKLEAQTISRLSHPNTVALFDHGVDEHGVMYFAMEWLEGRTVAEALATNGPFDPLQAASISLQVCNSLAEAHRKGIIHRDLKPGNLFLVDDGVTKDFVKVVDFGVAKLLEDGPRHENITKVGAVCGTPEFMSPEQALGEPLDGRSDIYSLGCCLYAMVQGTPPFSAPRTIDVALMHRTDPFPRLPGKAPPGLQAIIDRCSAKRPEERYPTAEAVAEAITTLLSRQSNTSQEMVGLLTHHTHHASSDGGARLRSTAMDSAHDEDELELLSPLDALDDGRFDSASAGAAQPLFELEATSYESADEDLGLFDIDDEQVHDTLSGEHELIGVPISVALPSLRSGNLSDTAVPRLFFVAHLTHETGYLTLTRGRQEVRVPVRDGHLVREDASGHQINAALAAFAWSEGHYALESGTATGAATPLVPLIWKGTQRHASVNAVAMFLADQAPRYPVATDKLDALRDEHPELATVFQVLSACDGQRTVAELTSVASDFESLGRALMFGTYIDGVVLCEQRTQAPVLVEYDTGEREDHSDLLLSAEVLQRQIDAFDGNVFDVLGLEPGSDEDAIRRACQDFVRRFSQSKMHRMPPRLATLAKQLRDRTAETERALLDQAAQRSAGMMSDETRALVSELGERLEAFRNSPPDELLGTWLGCGRNAIEDAYFRLVREHHPDQYAFSDDRVVRSLANDVFITLQQAYQRVSQRETSDEPLNSSASQVVRPVSGAAAGGVSRPRSEPLAMPPTATGAFGPARSGVAPPTSGSFGSRSGVSRPVSSPQLIRPSSPAGVSRSGVFRPISEPIVPAPPTLERSGTAPSGSRPLTPEPFGARPRTPDPLKPRTPTQQQGHGVSRGAPSSTDSDTVHPAGPSPRTSQAPARPAAGRSAGETAGSFQPIRPAAPAQRQQPSPGPGLRPSGAPVHRPDEGTNDLRKGNIGFKRRKMSEILAERGHAPAQEATVEQGFHADVRPATSRPQMQGLVSPTEHFRKGERFLRAQQYESARKAFSFAVEGEPENGKYAAHLAWTEYLCDPESIEVATAKLTEIRHQFTKLVDATYFLAQLALKRQDLDAAHTLLQGVLKRDPKHMDAQRDVRLVKQRLEEGKKSLLSKLFRRK